MIYPERPHRYQTHIPVQVAGPCGPQVAYIVDINEAGACVAGLTGVDVGEAVVLHAMDDERVATVRWTANKRAGVLFENPIPAKHLNLMRFRGPGFQHGKSAGTDHIH